MTQKNDQGHWIDASGHPVPVKYVKPHVKLRERLIENLFKTAEQLSEKLSEMKETVWDSTDKFFLDAEKLYGQNERTAEGNKTLTNFSNTKKLQFNVAKFIDFDERLVMAKTLIDECIRRWAKGSNDNIKLLIDRAFEVDKKGKIDKDRILQLRDLDIDDTEWRRAIELINDSIRVVGRRTYISFWKKDEAGEWHGVPLSIKDV